MKPHFLETAEQALVPRKCSRGTKRSLRGTLIFISPVPFPLPLSQGSVLLQEELVTSVVFNLRYDRFLISVKIYYPRGAVLGNVNDSAKMTILFGRVRKIDSIFKGAIPE